MGDKGREESTKYRSQLAIDELNRRLDRQSQRQLSAQSTAGVLIAASVISATLHSARPNDGWLQIAVVLSLTSAVFGIASFLPRAIQELDVRKLRERTIKQADDAEAVIWLVDRKMDTVIGREKLVGFRLRMVKIGALVLVGSLVCVALSTLGVHIVIGK